MRLIIPLLLLLIPQLSSQATEIKGHVRDAESREALTGATLVAKDSVGRMLAFVTTDAQGWFKLDAPSPSSRTVEVSYIGYEKQTLGIDSVTGSLEILLAPGTVKLREVTIKGEAIRQQGDTITYLTSSFAQEQDRTIGDVLSRMPGIEVAKSGKIKYQGEDINKFYIEGADMLEGRYGLATNGIDHEDVGAVEVMENHQPLQVLSGLSFSDKAAINLKLKENAKVAWSLHGTAALGVMQPQGSGDEASALWQGELFGMAMLPSRQSMFTLRSDNTGDDLSGLTYDFNDDDGLSLAPYVDVALPQPPALADSHTLFNRTAVASANNLWKLKRGELKTSIDYRYNRTAAQATETTTYYLPGDSTQLVISNVHGRQADNCLNLRAEYELNHKTVYANNILKGQFLWSGTRLATTGSVPNHQKLKNPQYSLSNDFKAIKKFGQSHLLTFISQNHWESMPQTLSVSQANGLETSQAIHDVAFSSRESAAYTLVIRKVTFTLDGGVKGYFRSMSSDLGGFSLTPRAQQENRLKTGYFSLSGSAKMEYKLRRVNFILELPVAYAYYDFDGILANRSQGFFSPTVQLVWKPTKRFIAQVSGGAERSPMSLHGIHSSLIMEDYRTLNRGVDDFYASTSQHVSARVAYKHTRAGVFANSSFTHLWSQVPYAMGQQVLGQYVIYSYEGAKTGHSRYLAADASIGKTLGFIHGSASISGTFSRNSQRIFSQNVPVTSVTSTRGVSGKIAGRLASWLNVDASVSYYGNRLDLGHVPQTPWLSTLSSLIKIVVRPHSKWEWLTATELLRTEPVSKTYQTTVLADTRLTFKATKKAEINLDLCNLFNKRFYRYSTFSQLSSYESTRPLRPRQFMLSLTFKP